MNAQCVPHGYDCLDRRGVTGYEYEEGHLTRGRMDAIFASRANLFYAIHIEKVIPVELND
ncbi:hypothetical protein RSAG8_06781, partial [Rhizoctonia solani AG-8 WAC10335]